MTRAYLGGGVSRIPLLGVFKAPGERIILWIYDGLSLVTKAPSAQAYAKAAELGEGWSARLDTVGRPVGVTSYGEMLEWSGVRSRPDFAPKAIGKTRFYRPGRFFGTPVNRELVGRGLWLAGYRPDMSVCKVTVESFDAGLSRPVFKFPIRRKMVLLAPLAVDFGGPEIVSSVVSAKAE